MEDWDKYLKKLDVRWKMEMEDLRCEMTDIGSKITGSEDKQLMD